MNLRRYDLNLLVVVEAVLREGSISAAALRLGLTQPAVSQALARARAMFGDPLMVRSGRGLQATPRAIELQAELAALLEQVETLIDGQVFDPAQSRRSFSIAASDLAEMVVMSGAMARLVAEAPLCRFQLWPARHDYGEVIPDVVLMGAAPPEGPWLSCDLYQDRFVMLARRGHQALGGALSAEAFAALPQAMVSPRGDGASGPVDAALSAVGLSRQVHFVTTRFGSLPTILAKSGLVAAVPARFAALPAVMALCARAELPVAVAPFTMRLVWHRTRDSDPAQQWLRERIVASVATEDGRAPAG